MTTDPHSTTQELQALKRRVEELEARLAPRPSFLVRRRGLLLGLTGLLSAIGAGTVLAANGNCPNGLPYCFASNTPAMAAEVNTNFMQLKEWLEAKVGPVSSAAVTSTSITVNAPNTTTAALTVNSGQVKLNDSRLIGTNAVGNFHLDTTGNAMYLNWFSGPGGIYFGNGNAGQAGRIDTAGNMQLSGNLNIAGTGGNTPHGCVLRAAPANSYNAMCASGEIAVGGGGRCASLYRLTESLPWGGPLDTDSPALGVPPVAWRSVCQVWGNAGAYAYPQAGAYAVCCRY